MSRRQVVAAPESADPQAHADPQTRDRQDDEQFEIDAPVVAIAAHVGVTETEEAGIAFDVIPPVTGDTFGVTPSPTPTMSDDAIAALIAEAESLDAAAELEVVTAPDPLELGSVEVELAGAAPVEAMELEAASPMDLELASHQPIAELVVEPTAELMAEPIAESVPEPIAESIPEPIAESVAEPIAELIAEPVVEAVVASAVVEPAIEVEPADRS